jgi:hypothetical protein
MSLGTKAQLSVDAMVPMPVLPPPIALSTWTYTTKSTIFQPPTWIQGFRGAGDLAWLPIDSIQKTLESTTQMAKAVTNYPVIRHMAAQFKALMRFCLK